MSELDLLKDVEPSKTPLTDEQMQEEDPGMVARANNWYGEKAEQAKVGLCRFCNLKEGFVICHHSGWTMTTNFYPRSQAHLLVMPDRHIIHVAELSPEDAIARQRLEQLGHSLLEECFNITDVWFLLRDGKGDQPAGKSVAHLHSHIMHYYHGILLWEDDRGYPDRIHRTPEEVGFPILPRGIVAGTLQRALAKRLKQ